MQNKGRIVEKISTKNENIIIVHNEKKYRLVLDKTIDIKIYNVGDIIRFSGKVFNGNYSEIFTEIMIDNIEVLKCCLLKNSECAISSSTRFNGNKERQYFHAKMIRNVNSINRIKISAQVYKLLRELLDNNNFVECRTPILTESYQGGGALPFKTYVNYKHKENYLRSNSLRPLMMYIAGGLDRVYEIGDYFRNGSIGKMHSVPYTALELYATDMNYEDMIKYAKEIFTKIISNLSEYNLSLTKEIESISFCDYMRKYEYDEFSITNLKEYFQFKKLNYCEKEYDNINMLYKVFKEDIIQKNIQPIIIYDLPAGISPFIERNSIDSSLLKRAFVVFKGYTIMEITYSNNEYEEITSETNKQAKHLETNRQEIDNKEHNGYIHALQMGILPTASITMSVERFIALLCDDEDINEYKIVI